MTRKDYVALAEAFALVKPYAHDILDPNETWARCVGNVANVLAADNPRFDRERFVKACLGEKS